VLLRPEFGTLARNTVRRYMQEMGIAAIYPGPNLSRRHHDHGKGRALDNILTERLWRSVTYEEVYLYEYASPRDVRQGITRYMSLYNGHRPPQALAYQTPVSVSFAPPPVTPGASGGPHDLTTATP